MDSPRRSFLTAGLATVGTATLLDSTAGAKADTIECLDYGRSLICNTSTANAVRFWVESRTILYDDEAGTKLVIYQCGSCKSEHTFAEENLLQEDNYDFMPIYGGEDMLILRRHVDVRDRYRQLRKVKEVWGEPNMQLHYGKTVTELKTFEQIRDVTATDTPLVAQQMPVARPEATRRRPNRRSTWVAELSHQVVSRAVVVGMRRKTTVKETDPCGPTAGHPEQSRTRFVTQRLVPQILVVWDGPAGLV